MPPVPRLILIVLVAVAGVGCGDMFERKPGQPPQVGDAPSPLTGGQMWNDSPADGPTIYIVTGGDHSFLDIARCVYGDGSLWSLIEEANPDVDETQLGPGQQIMIPALPEVKDGHDSRP